jgi:MoaA/NifB/PqqE/SkfB family radical SAM enzyme
MKNKKTLIRMNPDGALLYSPGDPLKIRLDRSETESILKFKGSFPEKLSSPEIMHLEISSHCLSNCPHCPTVEDRGKKEPTLAQLESLFKQLRDEKVVEISFGGGEPFLRNDIFEIAALAKAYDLSVSATTHWKMVKRININQLSIFDQVNVSLITNEQEAEFNWNDGTYLNLFKKWPTRLGFNIITKNGFEKHIENIAEFAAKTRAEIFLLSYKPSKPKHNKRLKHQNIGRDIRFLQDKSIKVRLDCVLSRQCAAIQRIGAMACGGDIYPCSFVRTSIGNVFEKKLSELWGSCKDQNPLFMKFCPWGDNQYED